MRPGRGWIRPPVLAAGAVLLAMSHATSAVGQAPSPMSSAASALQELGRKVQDRNIPEPERLALVRGLGQWGTAQVREPLIALLQDPSAAIREAAARALGWEGNREATAPLRQRLELPTEVPAVKASALESLGKIGDETTRDAIVAAVKDPEPDVRGAALGALTTGPLTRETDRLPFLRALAADGALDLLVRCEAIQALGKAKDRESQSTLMRLLESERPIPMPLPRSSSQGETMAVRYRQARDVRAWAAAVLGVLEAKEALPLLLQAAEDPRDFFLRVMATNALVAWNPPEAAPVWRRRIDDPFADVRALALAGIARAGDRSMRNAVIVRLSDPAPNVRVRAIDALVELDPSGARTELESLRSREVDSTVQSALEAAFARLPR